jgi:hypothetical protein
VAVSVAVPVTVTVGVAVWVGVPVGVDVVVWEGVGVIEGVTPGAIVGVRNWVGVARKVAVAAPGVSVKKTENVGMIVKVAGTPSTVDSRVGVTITSGSGGTSSGSGAIE